MRHKHPLSLVPLLLLFLVHTAGCKRETDSLREDAARIAAIMCRSVEAMRNLKSADPADSMLVMKLQAGCDSVESEMTVLYADFRKRWGQKISDPEFGKEFRKYLNAAMLDCKSLSKEDRENFERGAE